MGTASGRPFFLVAFAVSLALGGCAPEWFVLEPQVGETALVAGRAAAYYPIPAAAPRGDVHVVSFGTTKIRLPEGPRISVLQARLLIADDSDVPWTLDTREQYGVIPGEGRSRPVLVGSDADGAPIVTISPGGRRTVDLYFPLPAGMNDVDDIPRFDLEWRLDAGGEIVAERTPFERIQIVRAPSPAFDYGVANGYGPFYWYDPFWPGYTFDHPVIIYPPIPYPYVYPHRHGPYPYQP